MCVCACVRACVRVCVARQPNTQVLRSCGNPGTESFMLNAQCPWIDLVHASLNRSSVDSWQPGRGEAATSWSAQALQGLSGSEAQLEDRRSSSKVLRLSERHGDLTGNDCETTRVGKLQAQR